MRVLAVAVTYNPDPALLSKALQAVSPQVQGVAIVDNGSTNSAEVRRIASDLGAQLIANGQNAGIAAAQNQGTSLAQAEGFSHVLLLDQDTVLGPNVVEDLKRSLAALEGKHGPVAAVGPAYYEVNSQQPTRAYRASGPTLSRIPIEVGAGPIESDFIIASGSLIPLPILDAVGGFREDLFIDLVDVEWCFRARAAGYRSFLAPSTGVDHHLGSGTVRLGARQIALHTPIRNYYWVRNAIWMARQPYTPFAWRCYFLSRSLAFLVTYTTLADRRGLRFRLISRAIWHSLNGRFGRLQM